MSYAKQIEKYHEKNPIVDGVIWRNYRAEVKDLSIDERKLLNKIEDTSSLEYKLTEAMIIAHNSKRYDIENHIVKIIVEVQKNNEYI